MAELKTKKNDASAEKFIASVENETRRTDAETLLKVFSEVTGEEATMWGDSIIGFGTYDYTYASGHSGSWPRTGFSPRKQSMSLYIMPGFENSSELMAKLGKHRVGKSCLYINKLSDVDIDVLRELVEMSYKTMSSAD